MPNGSHPLHPNGKKVLKKDFKKGRTGSGGPNSVGIALTQQEKETIDTIVKAQVGTDGNLSEKKIEQVAELLNRTPATVAKYVEKARNNLIERAERYTNVHMDAVEGALQRKDFDTAAKHAEWALERISVDGKRIVDHPKDGDNRSSGIKIVLGVVLGGVGKPSPGVETEIIDVQAEPV